MIIQIVEATGSEYEKFVKQLRATGLEVKQEVKKDAPRRCADWSDFEDEVLRDKLDTLAVDLAAKFGRTTLAIKYRIDKHLHESGIEWLHSKRHCK